MVPGQRYRTLFRLAPFNIGTGGSIHHNHFITICTKGSFTWTTTSLLHVDDRRSVSFRWQTPSISRKYDHISNTELFKLFSNSLMFYWNMISSCFPVQYRAQTFIDQNTPNMEKCLKHAGQNKSCYFVISQVDPRTSHARYQQTYMLQLLGSCHMQPRTSLGDNTNQT